jgi:preprotein translocase subunit SecA
MSETLVTKEHPLLQSGTRSAVSKQLARLTSTELIPHIRALTESLRSLSPEQLQNEVQLVRREMARGQSPTEPHLLIAGLAMVAEALQRTVSVNLYDVQLIAAIAITRRCIAQMQTGEGKTFVALTAALHLSLTGRGVHVITPNVYLAERDHQLAAKVAVALGISVALLPEREDASKKTPAYDADVTYGTGHEFGFDYQRDQLTLREKSQQRLGDRLLNNLRQNSSSRRATMQRGLAYAIVDEADSVLIDDAGSPLVLSFGSNERAPDANAHLIAKALTEVLQPELDYVMEASSGRVALTEAGVQRCHLKDVGIPVLQLARPWTEYVQQALRARHLFRRGVHYVVQEDEVRIVDETTGRIFEDRSWQDGLHQAIEASENLPITAETHAVAQVTRQRFFRLYENLSGMTGTAVGCERELHDVYTLAVEPILLRVPSQRNVLPTRFFVNNDAKYHAIAQDVMLVQQLGRAVLIGTRSISDSETIAAKLASLNIECQLLNGLQDAAEADIISHAGDPRSVTIATNLAGRGTDIHLHSEVRAKGGLHVIVAECQTSSRMDRQLIGRCARQGDPGSAQAYASAEDHLISLHGPWLLEAMIREADANGEVDADFSSQLKRIQASAERQQYAARINMLRRDIARDSLLKSVR